MIRTDSDEYFIEPLERGTQEHEERGRVHVVYRRSAVLQAPSDISLDYHQIGTYHWIIKVLCASADSSCVLFPVFALGLGFSTASCCRSLIMLDLFDILCQQASKRGFSHLMP